MAYSWSLVKPSPTLAVAPEMETDNKPIGLYLGVALAVLMAAKKKAPARRRNARRTPMRKTVRRKKTRGISISNVVAGVAGLNAVSGPLLGRDLHNGFRNDGASTTDADLRMAGIYADPFAVYKYAKDEAATNPTISPIGSALKAIVENLRGVASPLGVQRTVAPVAVGAAAKVAVRMTRPNRLLPMSVRRFVRF